MKRSLALVALMASNNISPGDCFGAVATVDTPKASRTKRQFTLGDRVDDEPRFYNPMLSTGFSTRSSTGLASQSPDHKMPTWLRLQKAHLVHVNMEKLRASMLSSFFTENEILKLTYAIQEAANEDPQRMAGAAEFCLIMVETMEMGLNALVAAAFHYCHCIAAREQSVQLPNKDVSPWEARQHHGVESFGEHAVRIERDSARLKRLEVVASLVNPSNAQRVTPDDEEAHNLRNLFLTEANDWRALAIRGAACLYRLRGLLQAQREAQDFRVSKESGRVCREALRIYAPLASRLGMHRLKNELEDAAFRILYRRQHGKVTALKEQKRDATFSYRDFQDTGFYSNFEPNIGESMAQILEEVQLEMTHVLNNDPVFSHSVDYFQVTGRVKESYSTWKKMLRNGFTDVYEVPDALALRIVLRSKKEHPEEADEVTRARERALCYYAQKLCTERWAPLVEDGRFKDYISNPKPNGYQSLHYTAGTAWNGEDWSMEIQVRSEEMHKVAEFGVASHWDYKTRSIMVEGGADEDAAYANPVATSFGEQMGSLSGHHSDAYLRGLQEWHWKQHGRSFATDAEPSSIEPLILNDEGESKLRLERIHARTQRLAPYIEALTEAQSDLARENVFVFLHQSEKDVEGAVVALPAGSVVIDALRYCELPIFSKDVITHNGVPASLTTRLVNGDVLSIPSLTPVAATSM